MHYAAQFGQLDCLSGLLRKSAQGGGCMGPRMLNDLTETPLHLAAACYTRCERVVVNWMEYIGTRFHTAAMQ